MGSSPDSELTLSLLCFAGPADSLPLPTSQLWRGGLKSVQGKFRAGKPRVASSASLSLDTNRCLVQVLRILRLESRPKYLRSTVQASHAQHAIDLHQNQLSRLFNETR